MRFSHFPSCRLKPMLAGVAGLLSSVALISAPAHAQQVFGEEFNSGSFNSNGNWIAYDNSLSIGRTQFGQLPTIGSDGTGSFLRVPLHTYSPAGTKTQGTEVYTKQLFGVGTGLEFEAKVRGVNMPKGVCFAFFTYSEKNPRPNDYLKEEIDYEMLSNQPVNKVWSNIWNDGNPRYGGNDGVHQQDSLLTVPGMDYTGWTTYTLRWYPDRMEWYVNGTLARTSTTVVPDDPMAVHFNIWAPESGWGLAYNAAIQPTNVQANDAPCYMDVDYLRVRKLPAPATGVWGNGDGLKANYYPTPDLTGAPVTRVDPRVFDDWQQYSPDPKIPVDNFSARWSGAISSPYTENVTFTLRGDDGVRLYVNGQKLIDDWISTSAKDRTVTIPMTAGVKVPITVEYFDGTGGASCMMYWSSPSMAKTVVPQSQLFSYYDVTPPVISMTDPVNDYSYRAVTADGIATDNDSGVQTVSVRLQRLTDNLYWNGSALVSGAADVPAALSGQNWSVSLTNLPDGHYTVSAKATDNSGFTASTSSRTIWVDSLAPVVKTLAPYDGATYSAATSMNGNAIDAGPGAASVSVTLQRVTDGFYWSNSRFAAGLVENAAAFNGTDWKLYTSALAIGKYIVSARSTDYAGNVSGWVRANFSVVDGKAPVTTLTAPFNGSTYTAATSMNGTAKDVDSAISSVIVALRRSSDGFWWNNGKFASAYSERPATITGTNWKLLTGTLAVGKYTVSARSVDAYGNVSPTVNATFTVTGAAKGAAFGGSVDSGGDGPSVNSF